jgi:6-phosphogluconolactonase
VSLLPKGKPVTRGGRERAGAARPTRWHVFADAGMLSRAVAVHIQQRSREVVAQRGGFRIVLAGGTTPEAVYQRLTGLDTDWSRWQIYYGDERCVPANHAERNSLMAARSWLDRVPIAAENIFPIHAEAGADIAARSYANIVRDARPFDLVLLGMGEDGHTASLFPGHVHDPAELVHAVHDAPKPPPDRVSLGLAALNDAEEVIILVTGEGKRDAVARWKAGVDLPVAQVHGRHGVDVYIDAGAMGDNSEQGHEDPL